VRRSSAATSATFKKGSNRITSEICYDLTLGSVPADTGAAFAPCGDPSPTVAHVQPSFTRVWLFPSPLRLPISGEQCPNHHAQVEMRGSVVNYSGYPQRKMDAMVTWLFDHIMKSTPHASSRSHRPRPSQLPLPHQKVAASVFVVFYLLIASAPTLSYSCPFSLTPSVRRRAQEVPQEDSQVVGSIFSQKK